MLRWLALAVAVAMVAPATLSGFLHLCKARGEIQTSACCCQGEKDEQPPQGPTIDRHHADCCSSELHRSEQPAAIVDQIALRFDAPVLAALAPVAFTNSQRPGRVTVPFGSRGPPPALGPPIYIRVSSYLL